jgi:hypothetical protein
MKGRRGAAALVAAGAVLVLAAGAGCGGGGGGGGGSPLSKKEYARQGNALCVRYRKISTALGKPAGDSAKKIEQAVSLAKQFEADLAKLNPPLGEEARVERLRRLLEEQTGVLEQLLSAYKNEDWLKVYALANVIGKSGKGSKDIFLKLGLTKCFQD